MTTRDYVPGPARDARVHREGDTWTLILVRELRHPPHTVWQALTEPAQLREWAPFEADGSLGTAGATVCLSTVATARPEVSEARVIRAVAPTLLEYNWGDNNLRWELEPCAAGTRLSLWHTIPRAYISMGAAGWHICLDVLDRALTSEPLGRIVGADAMHHDWQRLNAEYATQFGLQAPAPAPPTPAAPSLHSEHSP